MKSHSSLALWILVTGIVVAVGFLLEWNRFALALFFLFIAARLVRDIAYFVGPRDRK